MRLSLFIFLFFIMPNLLNADNFIDIGSVGPTCPLKIVSHEKNVLTNLNEGLNAQEMFNPFHPKLQIESEKKTQIISIKNSQPAKIFVFGVDNDLSKVLAASINADYAVCVSYNSLKDIESFKLENNLKIPVHPGDEYTLDLLKIRSYPIIIEITDNE